MEPLVFRPLLKRIRWGGRRLGSVLGKPIGPEADYAESWELADYGAEQSVVEFGPFAGCTLRSLLAAHAARILGSAAPCSEFPLLIKFLDANDWLSLQVHPNDEQARQVGPRERGKSEAWVIIDAAPDSRICAGLRWGVTAAELRDCIAAGTPEDCLHLIPVQAGDCIYVPAGTVHALGPGILLAEVQQQSNITWRLFDWGRLGTDGHPRALHPEQAMACTDFARGPVNPLRPISLCDHDHAFEELVRCEYFAIRRHASVNRFAFRAGGTCRILMCLGGTGELRTPDSCVPLSTGRTVLVPAACESVQIQPQSRLTLLDITPPIVGR